MYPLIIKTDHHTPYMYIMPHLTVAVVSFTITVSPSCDIKIQLQTSIP